MRLRLGVCILALALAPSLFAGVTGAIRGVVRDSQTKEPVAGATVVATSGALQGQVVSLSDEAGLYYVTELPPGSYTISATFAGAVSQRSGIMVSADATINADMVINMANTGEVYTIEEKAPNVDVATSTVGVNVSKQFLQNVPMGSTRDFTTAIRQAPSADNDSRGINLSGATSPENQFAIDGVSATDPVYGTVGARLLLDFIEEFQVKEGGYGPEFGRATAGFINVITKSGSNEFHGSVFGYYTPDFLSANAKSIARSDSTFRLETRQKYDLRVGFEVGGPIVKDKLWFYAGYAPQLTSTDRIRHYTYLDRNPTTGNRAIGADGQPVFLELGDSDTVNSFQLRHEYIAKLTHLFDNNNRQSLMLRGTPLFQDAWFLGSGSQAEYTSNPTGFVGAAVYNYLGQFFDGKFKIDARLGANYTSNDTTGKVDLPISQLQFSEQLPRLVDQGLFVRPDGTDIPAECRQQFTDGTYPCFAPVGASFPNGAIGLTQNGPIWTFVQSLKFTNLFDAAGLHQIKYGIDFQELYVKTRKQYSGGFFVLNYGPGSFDGNPANAFFRKFGFARMVNGSPEILPNGYAPSVMNLNLSSFLGDTWNPISNLSFNYGLRWDVQLIYGVKTADELDTLAYKFGIMDNLAPRAGLVWDFTGRGRGAVKFNYGRFYESIPVDLNQRQFGGELSYYEAYECSQANNGFNTVIDPATDARCVRDPGDDTVLGGEDGIVAEGLKGQYSDEFILGVEYEPFDSWVFGVSSVYRSLGNVVEDISTDGGNQYLISNPGSFDLSQLIKLRREILNTQDPVERAKLENALALEPGINDFPKAIRRNLELRFQVDKKLSDHFSILASYLLSWTYGNYPGLVTENTGQLDPNITSQFDLPALLLNRMGYLQQDRRHRIKLGGFYRAAMTDYGYCLPLIVSVGINGSVQSGLPYEMLGRERAYGRREVFMMPRAEAGRMPWTWSIDANVGVGYEFSKALSLEAFASVFNLTNNQAATGIDAEYTASQVVPVEGADFNQVKHQRGDRGAVVVPNANYGNANAYQAPLSTQLGLRLSF